MDPKSKYKIAITGYTSGIGKAIYEMGESYGHDMVGFSRATGFNLKNIGKVYTSDRIGRGRGAKHLVPEPLPATAG